MTAAQAHDVGAGATNGTPAGLPEGAVRQRPARAKPAPRKEMAAKQADAVRLVLDEGQSQKSVAARLGVQRTTVFRWVKGELVRRGLAKAKPCREEGCTDAAQRHGRCGHHRYLAEHGLPMDTPRAERVQGGIYCTVPECGRQKRAWGLCPAHYIKKKQGRPDWDAPLSRRRYFRRGYAQRPVGLPKKHWRRLDALGAARGLTAEEVLREAAEVLAGLTNGAQGKAKLEDAFAWAQRVDVWEDA